MDDGAMRQCTSCRKAPAATGKTRCSACIHAERPAKERACTDCKSRFTTRNNTTRCSFCIYKARRLRAERCPCGAVKDERSNICGTCRNVLTAERASKRARSPQEAVELAMATALEGPGGCRVATIGSLLAKGYRRIGVEGGHPLLHRLVFGVMNGPIPDGLTIDHRCHNEALALGECSGGVCWHRQCIEPSHLEAVGAVENWARGSLGVGPRRQALTHCPQGHPYDMGNTYVNKSTGARSCRTCKRIRERARRAAAQG